MPYFWNPDDSLIPNMMIDTSPWSSCSRRSPWSPWSPCSSHTFSSTGPSVSPFRDFSWQSNPSEIFFVFSNSLDLSKCRNYQNHFKLIQLSSNEHSLCANSRLIRYWVIDSLKPILKPWCSQSGWSKERKAEYFLWSAKVRKLQSCLFWLTAI